MDYSQNVELHQPALPVSLKTQFQIVTLTPHFILIYYRKNFHCDVFLGGEYVYNLEADAGIKLECALSFPVDERVLYCGWIGYPVRHHKLPFDTVGATLAVAQI